MVKASSAEHLSENLDVFGWELNGEDMARLDCQDEGVEGAMFRKNFTA